MVLDSIRNINMSAELVTKGVVITSLLLTLICWSADLGNTFALCRHYDDNKFSYVHVDADKKTMTKVDMTSDVYKIFRASKAGHSCFLALYLVSLAPGLYALYKNNKLIILGFGVFSVLFWLIRIIVLITGDNVSEVHYILIKYYFRKDGYKDYSVAGEHFLYQVSSEYASAFFYPLAGFGTLFLFLLVSQPV